MPTTAENLARWHDHMGAHDQQLLWDMLHPDCVFESPVVHTPQVGRPIVFKYLASAGNVLGGDGFTYVGQWLNQTSAILEFTNTINGIKVNGIDMITWNDDGQITHFKVMVRPLKAINMIHQMMGEMLQKMASQPA
ncbi:nuclear transport factor 2 family protein [Sandarakinorhabdus oryzae]|uniref:nuclear transport factor 2 family protein n=1 Tax=Sandarakinorhabdus oryzae TaxID=2675220 RepID=UPI0012E0EA90|nr:nuclear transport factor 2 family protein [Sandarakinorhabdus oryzae]